MIVAWRIVKASFAASAFDGEGARRYGGRWNSPGRPAVYLGATPAIAALEVLAHNARPALLYSTFVVIEVRIPEESLVMLDTTALAPGWSDPHDTTASSAIGDAWLDSRSSLALQVPSAVQPLEHNVLIDVLHPDVHTLEIEKPRPFTFGPRLQPSGGGKRPYGPSADVDASGKVGGASSRTLNRTPQKPESLPVEVRDVGRRIPA